MRLTAKGRVLHIPDEAVDALMAKIHLWCEWEQLRQGAPVEFPENVACFVDEPLDEPWLCRRELIDDYGWLILAECETIVRRIAKVSKQNGVRSGNRGQIDLWTEDFLTNICQTPFSWSAVAPTVMEDSEFLGSWSPPSLPSVKSRPMSVLASRRCGVLPKQCYFNSRRAIMYIDDLADAYYVEGFCLAPDGYAFEHGWISTQRRIVDPTLPEMFGEYFPGLAFKGRQGMLTFLRTKKGREVANKPFFYAFGRHGKHSPSFSAAEHVVSSRVTTIFRTT